jgi:hypothetical protein
MARTGTIEEIKAEVGRGGGLAQSNLFMINLPTKIDIGNESIQLIDGLGTRQLNYLCTAATMPGRTLQAHERRTDMDARMVPYGYAKDDVTLTFKVLNDCKIRRYWEKWQEIILGGGYPYELEYHKDFSQTINITQLKRGISLQTKNYNFGGLNKVLPPEISNRLGDINLDVGFLQLGADLATGELTVSSGTSDTAVYMCTLLEAYPISISPVEYGDDKNEFVTFTVTLSYRDWGSTLYGTSKFDGLFSSFFSRIVSKVLS